jgi:hypothetical protein
MTVFYGPGFGTVYPTRLILDRSIAGIDPLDIVYTGEGYHLFDYEHRLRPIVKRMVLSWLDMNPLRQCRDKLSLRVFEVPVHSQDRGVSLDTGKDNILKHTYFGVQATDPDNPYNNYWIPQPGLDTFMQNALIGWRANPATAYQMAFVNMNQGRGGVCSYARSAQIAMEEICYSEVADLLFAHELVGHGIGRCGDEYGGNPSAPPSRSEEEGWTAANSNFNLTGNFDMTLLPGNPNYNTPLLGGRAQIKWSGLVSTPNLNWPTYSKATGWNGIQPAYNAVGTFEGARYSDEGWYRSQYACRMVQFTDAFCAACCNVIRANLSTHIAP